VTTAGPGATSTTIAAIIMFVRRMLVLTAAPAYKCPVAPYEA